MIYRSNITYEQYFKMHDSSANAILKRILISLGKSLDDIAKLFQISINEAEFYLTQKRLNEKDSAILSEYLKIGTKDYFLILQQNHDRYLKDNERSIKDTPNLTKIRKSTFWDVNIQMLDWRKGYKFVISRIYEYGNDTEKEEIKEYYGQNIVDVVLSEKNNMESRHFLKI